ncbi:MAG: lysophospholipid acyltransferase family protein [Rickettsiales bacterium]
MKKLKKKFFNSAGFRYLLSFVIAFYINLIYWTSRKIYSVPEAAIPYVSGERQMITVFWHGRLLLMPKLKPRPRSMDVLISAHRDGLVISETMKRFGIGTVAGSSTQGSLSALKNMLKELKKGGNISITPDGPRGPFQIAAPGVAHIAAKSGVAVLPASFSSSKHKRMRSWDRFMVALPFSTIYFVVGSPVYGKPKADKEQIETLRLEIEAALSAVTAEADRQAGIIPT